ncbi:G-type lectin S-receptor-like serine/threonine-protein kinase SD2-5 [Chenopodium quinoa]|uniref:G-type lectin S-receptor-like serine/threonine-protein kinase SD2-5 n=1 Tax=Chenopodium quinoa TaxID=63459 RepID=UPI000B779574|nr:G-type lectin S-receptor-like serine/threonine-protein kinase SD2-5 [Chenopodium quinoa]
MGNWGFLLFKFPLFLLILLALNQSCIGSIQRSTKIFPGFEASQMGFIDNNGLFLLSRDTTFAFGFKPTNDVTLFLLVIVHQESSTIVWTANRVFPVGNSDSFVFDSDGSVSLQSGGKAVWKPDTGRKPVSVIELQDSGNLVLYGSDNSTIVWESFKDPTDTLLSNQDFVEGMKLSSNPNKGNLSYVLEIKSGDMILSAGYETSQTYWSMKQDTSKIINKDGRGVKVARIELNSWKFYDDSKSLLWQLVISPNSMARNTTWIAVLGSDGFLDFLSIGNSPSKVVSQVKIPSDLCQTPEPCDAYNACSSNRCQCPSGLVSRSCTTGISDPCGNSSASVHLVNPGDGLSYFALGLTQPSMKTDLDGCKASCTGNCSCLGLFFDNSSRSCYLFDRIGSFTSDPTSKYSVFVKATIDESVEEGDGGGSSKHLPVVITIVILTVLIVVSMVYVGYRHYTKKKEVPGSPQELSEEDNFLESLAGMPVRFSYQSLQDATNNFSVKLGQGGFGSVYRGKLPDGTPLAVKKLEGVGQGKKEFRAEVSIIGSIHHNHLVRLKGFCTEGSHRLLAYEFMANNSLDKWIFKRNKVNDCLLDWPTRFNIAVGTAKGLAYLHEDCEVKIVHCDIKPENVLLDEHFEAKVSDFGLAKLMTREQSHVFTTLRGTRGYLAPEWITNYAISEKSDVYSYGMVLLEIIGGRKSYDPSLPSEKSHFPAYAFKMVEEGKLMEILDSGLQYGPNEESVKTAIKVALWCIQEDMSMRPPMTKVVQMLEGISSVPMPPTSSLTGARLFSNFFKLSSNEGTATGSSSGPSDCNSEAYQSAVRLSGPR